MTTVSSPSPSTSPAGPGAGPTTGSAPTPPTGRRGGRPRAVWLAAPLALIASAGLVYQASTAAFVATTSNPGNTFSSGQVVLTDDRAGTAMFTTAGEGKLVPGSTGYKCIDVTYSGDVAAQVRLHAAYGATSALAPYLQLTVDQVSTAVACSATGNLTGDSALFGTPTGTAQGLVTGHGSYATGLGTWAPTGTAGETRRYRIAYTLADDNAAQDKQVELELTWEARTS